MKHTIIILIIASLLLSMQGCKSAGSTKKSQAEADPDSTAESTQATTEEPLLLDDEPLLLDDEPLLLDDEPLLLEDESEDESADSGADNSRCHVCHVNYMTEEIAVTHAKIGMGCASCHGESDDHIADESWASGGNGTAPDKMYPRETIIPFCMGCHTKEKIDQPQHAPVFAEGDKQKVCTDCHGEHRLHVRKCKWK